MIELTTAEAGILQSKAYRSLREFLGTCLKPHGVSLTGWALLGLVAGSQGIRASVLAHELSVKRPLVTDLLTDFEKKNLLTRRVELQDSRAKKIFLTDKGKQFVQSLEAELRQNLRVFLDDVSQTELTTYLKVLEKIANKFNNAS